VLISEGLTSVWEAVRTGLGVAVLPDWMIREDLLSGRLERVLPQWNAAGLLLGGLCASVVNLFVFIRPKKAP
jgi:DNA-binding transcriptional LysR family regulator